VDEKGDGNQMPRQRTGHVVEKKRVRFKKQGGKRVKVTAKFIYARVRFTDDDGKVHEHWRRADDRSHAKDLLKGMVRELDDHGPVSVQSAQMTFEELATYYRKHYLVPAKFVGDRKVAGQRSYRNARSLLAYLEDFFGPRKLRSITYATIERYKARRLETTTIRYIEARLPADPKAGNRPERKRAPRSITSVNRELQLLRAMLNVAVRESWVLRNPFSSGQPLISSADEQKRERILSRAEEVKLLAACSGARAHLRAIVICLVDTGMRRNELLQLRWEDVDFDARLLTIQARNTKTLRQRQVPMTSRVASELESLRIVSEQGKTDIVFGVTEFKRSFGTARKLAGLENLRLHDLRHTAASRMIAKGIPLPEVARVLGHSILSTTYRYVDLNTEGLRRISEALDEYNYEASTATPAVN
jgi:integrase